MLDIKFIRENKEAVAQAIKVKNLNFDLDELLDLDSKLLETKREQQELQEERNTHSKKIPKASAEARPVLIAQGKEIGEKLNALKPIISELEEKFQALLLRTPNIPSSLAPVGKSEEDNVEVKVHGEKPTFSFKPRDHVEILEENDWAEFEKVAKVCGSRSYSLKNEMVLLELALHRFAMDILIKKGFNLMSFPSLAREEALVGTGHFPDGRDQVYHLPEDNIFLSGTAEVQANSLYSNEILNEKDLPILVAGYSPCFRREAGSYGRDVRGLIRVHQFMKVEQYVICRHDEKESEKFHQMLLETSEEIVQALELPYRVVECCTGDMGTGKVRMYDVECWVPSEDKYRETHSCSSLHDWQARRTNTRYREESSGKVKYVYTLNNTAIATPRIMVSFLENHQNEDGSINIPEKLRSYLGADILRKK